MGDAGSQLLGFLLAALGLAASWTTAGTTVATMLLPLLVLAIPILDTTLVTVRRLAERRPVTQGGKDHTSHRLVYYGLSETKAVALLALIAVALGATSVAYNVLDRPAITALGVLVTFALLVQFGGFLAELSEQERRGRPGDTRLRHAVAVQPRRLVELVVDAALVGGTFLASYLLFVDGRGTELQRGTFLAVLPIVLGTTYVVYVLFGVYRRAWRYATTRDLVSIALASGHRDARRVRDRRRDARPRRLPAGRSSSSTASPPPSLAAASRCFVRLVPEAGGGAGRRPPARPRRRCRTGGPRPRRATSAARTTSASSASSTTTRGFADAASRACPCSARSATRDRARGDARRRARRHDPRRAGGAARGARPCLRRGGCRPPCRPRAPASRPDADPSRRRVSADVSAAPLPRASATSDARARVEALAPLVGAYLLPRDALRVAGVAARDADDLLRRARDDADLARDRGDRPRGAARRARTASRASSRG